MDLMEAVQQEVTRIRALITTSEALLPQGRGNFAIYEMILKEADRAVREQDAVVLAKMLPELKGME